MRPIYWVFLAAFVGLTCYESASFAGVEGNQVPYNSHQLPPEFDSPCQSHIGYFKKNAAKIDADIAHLIRSTLARGALNECPELFIVITGQSSISETNRVGLDLSKRRAMAIEKLFIKSGVPKERMIVHWIGDKKAEDRTHIGQELSQKVEIDFWRSKDLP